MSELQQTIERLYDVFGRYPRPTQIVSCPCGCTKPEETAPLLAVGLHDLPGKHLISYAFSAITTQGSADDFRYFLPRLFEAITQDLDGVCPEILFGKLTYARWQTWPTEDKEAIRAYMHALWRTTLGSYPLERALPPFFEIETVLACIAQTNDPLKPFLVEWTECQALPSDLLLLQFVGYHGNEFADGQSPHEAFWKKHEERAQALRRWLLHPDIMRRIEGAAHLLPEDGYEHLFGPSLDVLRREVAAEANQA